MGLLYNPATKLEIESFIQKPSHAVLLTGPKGSGKRAVASELASALLSLPAGKLDAHPYVHIISSDKAVSIEEVRGIEQFLRLKVPSQARVTRIVVVENAQTMGHEAQNALLKTLEEPPAGTVLLLIATNSQALLPTVQSRLQTIAIKPIPKSDLMQFFTEAGFDNQAIAQAAAVSGGLPGLMQALLGDEDHPLAAATTLARELLQESAYQRLLRVDQLSKQKPLAEDTLYILSQMAHARLQVVDGQAALRWQQVMSASYTAAELLRTQVQPKLVLDQLMLDLG